MGLIRDEHLPRIRLLKHEGFDQWYGKLINGYQLLPLANELYDAKNGNMVFIYKDHISVHVNYSE